MIKYTGIAESYCLVCGHHGRRENVKIFRGKTFGEGCKGCRAKRECLTQKTASVNDDLCWNANDPYRIKFYFRVKKVEEVY